MPVGTSVVWTYRVFNDLHGNSPVRITDIVDDFGPVNGDFVPVFVDGDLDNDGLLATSEVWRYSSRGVVDYQVIAGPYVGMASVTVEGVDRITGQPTGRMGKDVDLNHPCGTNGIPRSCNSISRHS